MSRALRQRFFILATLCLSVLIVFSAMNDAYAQTSRLYLAGYMGLNTIGEQDFSSNSTSDSGSIDVENSLNFAGALGFRLSKVLRIEAELAYQNPDIDELEFNGTTVSSLGGDIEIVTGLANAYYDFTSFSDKFTPYITAGAGMGYFNLTVEDPGSLQASDSTYSFIYQAGTGVKYRPRSNLAYTLGYRYVDAPFLEVDDIEFDYSSHEIRFGIEYDLPYGSR